MTTITIDRAVVEQALEALENGKRVRAGEGGTKFQIPLEDNAITALRATLAQQEEPAWMHPWPPVRAQQDEPVATVAENATTQQRVVETPPSDYRRGYWDGFSIGKREGRIEAEDALAQQDEPVEPVAWIQPDHLQKARIAPFLCRVEPTQRCADFVPLYLAPPQRQPQTLDEALQQPRAMAQAYEAGYKAGVAAEREACAKACEHQPHWVACADAICARGNT